MSRSEDVRPLSRWITQSKESRKSAVCVWFSIPGHGNSTAQTPQGRGWEMSWPASRSLWLSLCVEKKSLLDVPYALPLMNPQNQVLASCFRASPCPHPFWPCFSHRFQTCACNSFSQPCALEPCQPGFDFTPFRAHHLHETLTTWLSICSSFSFSWPPDDSWLLESVLFLLQLYESVFNQ